MMSAAWGYQLVGNYLGWGRRGGKLRNTYKPMKTIKNEKKHKLYKNTNKKKNIRTNKQMNKT